MAYQLNPNIPRIQQPAVPSVCANDFVFAYPQASNLNYCCRPNTMLYGTAPFMAGKGSPADLIEVSDELRPQSTDKFNNLIVKTYEKQYFPLQNMSCSLPIRNIGFEPMSTRAQVQNGLFAKRYCNKNIPKQ